MRRRLVGTAFLAFAPAAVTPLVAQPAQTLAKSALVVPIPIESARGPNLEQPISVTMTSVPLAEALKNIGRKSGLRVSFGTGVYAVERPVTLSVSDVPLKQVLARVLEKTGITYQAVGDAELLFVRDVNVKPQAQGTIVGRVIDAKNKQPVRGATITLDGASKGVTTGDDGTFRITVATGSHTVTVRAIGFTRQSKTVVVTESQSASVEFVLETSTSVLDEVVVTGTVVATERKAIPNPITVITGDEIRQRNITRFEQLFRGEVPGVFAQDLGTQSYSRNIVDPGVMSRSYVYARGASNTTGEPTPLKTYVDGVEILDPSYLGTLDPQSIERVEIVTGPQAATVYGSGAIGGVMQIFTNKGNGQQNPVVTANLRYGMLETSVSNSRTPTHNDLLSVTGGTGPGFSYAASVTHNFTGQWQPGLFSRTLGGSLGGTHVRGPLTASVSLSATHGENGTFWSGGPLYTQRQGEGDWTIIPNTLIASRSTASSSNQVVALNVDYHPATFWQHHLTVGRTYTTFDMDPQAPMFATPDDSLYQSRGATGQRTSYGYNVTLMPSLPARLSTNITVGVTGTYGDQTTTVGCRVTARSSSYTACNQYSPLTVDRTLDDRSWGGFGRWQLGIFDQLYLTFGLRGERNPNYGDRHRIDWTPSNGLTYTIERGDLTLKLLGSYGKATRPPAPDQKLELVGQYPGYTPSQWAYQLANPELTPEYSRGPQGGFELYYGNVGSLTVNHYDQKVTNLIQQVIADSFLVATDYGETFMQTQYRYRNTATLRQLGWDVTASVNVGVLSLKGVYSWSDSRVVAADPTSWLRVGQMFTELPTHTGSLSGSYARGGTSLNLVANYVGSQQRYGFGSPQSELLYLGIIRSRLQMYLPRRTMLGLDGILQTGYVKSDLAASQRLTSWASVTLNVTNLGNSYASEAYFWNPTLGRMTTIGVSLRGR